MRIEQLEYFIAVGKHGSLRRASEHLHVSQPALSEAIAKLERELGVSLLTRRRSGARISPAGRELLEPITDVLASAARLRAAAGDHLASRLLRIGTVNAGTATLLLPALQALRADHPHATVEIRSLQHGDIEVRLAEGALDVGLVNLLDGDEVSPGIECTPLLTGRPVAVIPATHRLAALPVVSTDQLRGERFVGMRAGYLMHRFTQRLFGAEPPPEWYTTDGAEMGKVLVAQGIGIAVLPDYSVHGDPLHLAGLIVGRPIAGDRTAVTMAAVRRRQSRVPTVVRDVIRHLRHSGRQLGSAASGGAADVA